MSAALSAALCACRICWRRAMAAVALILVGLRTQQSVAEEKPIDAPAGGECAKSDPRAARR